ncbi:MAG: hypothetical protein AAB909_01200 [Patescibacteria group bacterium]
MKKYLAFSIFAIWLMFSTLSYVNGEFRVSSKVWSDFGAAIPLMRSFSQGQNWPPEHPLFPGEPIRYHYLFYLGAGLLERAGLRPDLALNLLSTIGFFGLMTLVYKLAGHLFGKKASLIAVVFLIFNSSFSFVDYFADRGLSLKSLMAVPFQTEFASFYPWRESKVAAFWNLNIYTNQRHLAFSYAIVLLIIYINYARPRYLWLTGILLATLASLNQAALLIAIIYLFFLCIQNRHLWKTYLFSALLGLPFLYPYLFMSHVPPQILFHPGFITQNPLRFWLFNLGLHFFFIPIGFLFASKKMSSLVFGTIVTFLLANLYQFSPDMFNNHKFINFAVIIGSMFTAGLIIKFKPAIRYTLYIILILGGLFDIFPIINDRKVILSDRHTNPDIQFYSTLPRKSVVLNSTWFYHPASIAGLPIFNGYSYFTWSYGYDQRQREKEAMTIYASPNKPTACSLLLENNISYVELNPHHEGFLQPNYSLWSNEFAKVYTNPETETTVYSVAKSCTS